MFGDFLICATKTAVSSTFEFFTFLHTNSLFFNVISRWCVLDSVRDNCPVRWHTHLLHGTCFRTILKRGSAQRVETVSDFQRQVGDIFQVFRILNKVQLRTQKIIPQIILAFYKSVHRSLTKQHFPSNKIIIKTLKTLCNTLIGDIFQEWEFCEFVLISSQVSDQGVLCSMFNNWRKKLLFKLKNFRVLHSLVTFFRSGICVASNGLLAECLLHNYPCLGCLLFVPLFQRSVAMDYLW